MAQRVLPLPKRNGIQMGKEIITYKLDDSENQIVSDFIERHSITATQSVRADLNRIIHEIANEAYSKGRQRVE